MRVNVVGPYLVTRTFVPLLMKRNTRTVVQISSGLGSITRNRLGMTDPEKNPIGNAFIAYNSSKAALNMRKYMGIMPRAFNQIQSCSLCVQLQLHHVHNV